MTLDQREAPYAGWRAAAATALIMPGATLAHTWAGGHVPPIPALVALSAVVLGASSLALRGTLRAHLLLPLVAGAQAFLHGSFAAVGSIGHAGHAAEATASPWTWQMLLAHAAVTVLTAVVWRLCERAVTDVVAAITRQPAYAGGRRDPLPAPVAHHWPTPAFLLDLSPRRGPPGVPGRA